MSLINQVLKDLDSRQPLQEKPLSTAYSGADHSDEPATDWLRFSVWGVTILLVVAGLVYIGFEDAGKPEPQAVTVVAPPPVVTAAPAVKTVAAAAKVLQQSSALVPAAGDSPAQVTEAVKAEEKPQPEKVPYLPLKIVADTQPEPLPVTKSRSVARPTKTESAVSVRPVQRSGVEQARYLISEGQLTGAEEYLKKLIKQKPDQIQPRELLIGMLLRNARTDEALKQIAVAKRFYPVRENLALLSAKIQLESSDVTAAVETLEKQREIGKAGVKTYAMLAPLYQQQGDYEKSAELYSTLIERDKLNGRYWVGLAVSLEALASYTGAANAYERALQSKNLTTALGQYARQRLTVLQQREDQP